MNHYTPKRIRWAKVLAYLVRGLAGILSRWPLLLLAAFLISPVGPHLRWEYTYEQRGTFRYMLDCQYLGSRGLVRYRGMGDCPILTMIDRREK